MNQCLVCPYYFYAFFLFWFHWKQCWHTVPDRKEIEIPQWLSFCSKGTEAIEGSEAIWKRTLLGAINLLSVSHEGHSHPLAHPWCVACSNSTWSHLLRVFPGLTARESPLVSIWTQGPSAVRQSWKSSHRKSSSVCWVGWPLSVCQAAAAHIIALLCDSVIKFTKVDKIFGGNQAH